jgi:hypothetical protein
MENCQLVDSIDPSFCLQCNDGFSFDINTSSCVESSASIPNCKFLSSSGLLCHKCENSFFLSSDKKSCIEYVKTNIFSTSSNAIYKNLNTVIKFNEADDIFSDSYSINSNCDDLVQVQSSGKCNFCGIGYYLDETGSCQSNPSSSCWIESISSYSNFSNVFKSVDKNEFLFKKIQEQIEKLDKKGSMLTKIESDISESSWSQERILNSEQVKKEFCFVCKPGYYQISNGSCILRT